MKACGLSEKDIRRRVVVLDTIPGASAPRYVAPRRFRREHFMSMVAAQVLMGKKMAGSSLVRHRGHTKQENVVMTKAIGMGRGDNSGFWDSE